MRSKQDLERLDSTVLAVLCQQVADNPSVDAATAEKAWQLKREWVLIVSRGTPPPSDYKANEKLKAEEAALVKRMAELLATI